MKKYRIILNKNSDYEVQKYSWVVKAMSNSDWFEKISEFHALWDAKKFLKGLKIKSKGQKSEIKIILEEEF